VLNIPERQPSLKQFKQSCRLLACIRAGDAKMATTCVGMGASSPCRAATAVSSCQHANVEKQVCEDSDAASDVLKCQEMLGGLPVIAFGFMDGSVDVWAP
jgi:hypothetical protein